MKVISFFSFKGGVGRTALMINVGGWWARKGYTVLMIDMDLFAPGLTYHKLKGPYLHPEGAGLGISDLLSTFGSGMNKDKIAFLPPHFLIREMLISRQRLLNPAGRLLMIDAGASVPDIQQAGGVQGVCGAFKSGNFVNTIKGGKAEKDENGPTLAYRNLAEYIRRDLESAEIPSLEKDGEPGKIDFVLIDCRTGFPELLDLSLGYLADDMVILSGLNDQNLAGLKETLRALDNRVDIGALPGTVTLVFSPVPAGEDDAVLDSLKNAHSALKSSMRPDKYGISEAPPKTHVLHYTPILAMRDDVIITLERPESMYAREAAAIADEIEGTTSEASIEDAMLKKARFDIFSFLTTEKPAGPAPSQDREVLAANPLSQLPPWWWPIEDRSPEKRMAILEKKMPANENFTDDREALLNKVCASISLSKDEKRHVMTAYRRLTEEQVKEVHFILNEQKRKFMVLWKNNPKHRSGLIKVYFGYQKDWKDLIAGSSKSADAIFFDEPFEGRGMFKGWEPIPIYWLLLGKEGIAAGRGEARVWESIDKAFDVVKEDETILLAEEAHDIFAAAPLKTGLFDKIEARLLEISGRHERILFKAATRRIKESGGNDSRAMADFGEVIEAVKKEKTHDAEFCFAIGSFILDHAVEFVSDCELILRLAVESDNKFAAPWNGLGNLYVQHLARPEESEAAYKKAIELDPKYAAAWNNLGNLYEDHLSRPEESEAAYRKAIELDPKFAYPWNGLGNLYQEHLSRPEESEAAYKKAIELDPKFALAWYNLGNLYKDHLSRPEESEAAYKKAIELDPKYALAWNNLGNLYMQHLARHEKSEEAYKKAIELDSKYAFAWNNLGILYKEHLSRPEESEAAYKKAIELDPKYAVAWCNLGNLYAKHLSRSEESEAAYKKAIELDPKDAAAWNNLGNLYVQHLARPEKSEAAYKKAIELAPKFAAAWCNLGNLYWLRLNRFDEGRAAYQKAIEIDPEYVDAYHNDVELALVEMDLVRAKSRLAQVTEKLKTDDQRRDHYMLSAALSLAEKDSAGITEAHRELSEINPRIDSPAAWNYKDMKPFIDTLPDDARRLFNAWVGAVRHESGGIGPEEAFKKYIGEYPS